MYDGRTVFSQLMGFVPRHTFQRRVQRYAGDRGVRRFTCWQQFLAMAFAQLTYRESLRDIEVCLAATPHKLYHMGFTGPVARTTLADANERRDWRIHADFAQGLIAQARRLYAGDTFAFELDQTVYALDSSTVDLCLSLFPWATFRATKAAIKLHTLLDLRGSIPTFIWITDGSVHDVRILDVLLPEPGSIYVLDRGYVDFERLWRLHEARAVFVIRAKKNLRYRRLYSSPVDRSTGLICDQTIVLTSSSAAQDYPDKLRRIRYRDPESSKTLVFLTNDFSLPAETIAALYRSRWHVELFFKWIKQHLRIKAFFGTSPNAVKTQIWIAIATYVLIAIARKRLNIESDLHTILQVLSVHAFEKVPLVQILTRSTYTTNDDGLRKQLTLLDF
ncbi:MAG: IS4 family transposase [Thermoanaerobaculia bacterium]